MSLDRKEIAKILLKCEAIKLNLKNKFVWSSGILSPIYCDNRVILSYPNAREALVEALAEKITECFADVEAIVGVATAGIAKGALLAQNLSIPYAYCRTEPKEHGTKKQLEGRLNPGSKVVVFEDLISTGGSSLKVVQYLRDAGFIVLGIQAIFTYGTKKAEENFSTHTSLETIVDVQSLMDVAILEKHITQEQAKEVLDFLHTL